VGCQEKLNGCISIELDSLKSGRTLRSAPALELKRVAVTTRRFNGSTAPTATSGVSTIAINLGGAVRMAACPNLTANVGVPFLGEALIPVLLLTLVFKLMRPLRENEGGGGVLIEWARELLLPGVEMDEVEKPIDEPVRLRVAESDGGGP